MPEDLMLRRAVEALVQAISELRRAEAAANAPPTKPGRPATKAALAAYERALGWKLPAQYRAFLALHDGYRGLNVFGSFASMKVAGPRGALGRRVRELARAGADDLDWARLVPIADVEGSHDFVYLEPSGKVVAWFHDLDSERYPSLLAYLRARTTECRQLAKEAPALRAELERGRAREAEARRAHEARSSEQTTAAAAGALGVKTVRQRGWVATVLPKLHERELRSAVALADGHLAVAEGSSKTVRVWARDGRLVRTIALPAAPSALERAGDRLIAVCDRQLVFVQGEELVASPACDEATQVAVSPDARTVAAFTAGKLGHFDVERATLRRSVEVKPELVAWCRGGEAVATLPFGGKRLSITSGKGAAVKTLPLSGQGYALAADRQARVLAAAGGPNVWLWDEALAPLGSLRLEDEGAWIQFVALSPDGARLAVSASGDVRVFRVADGVELARLRGSSRNAFVRFEGDELVEAGAEVRLWREGDEPATTRSAKPDGD